MPKLVQYAASAATVAGELEALFTIYEQLAPTTKVALQAEVQKVVAEYETVKTAVTNFKTASVFGKVSSGISLLSSVLDIGTFLQGIYADGETYFAAEWPLVQQHVANIKAVFTGTAPAPVAPALAAPAMSPVLAE